MPNLYRLNAARLNEPSSAVRVGSYDIDIKVETTQHVTEYIDILVKRTKSYTETIDLVVKVNTGLTSEHDIRVEIYKSMEEYSDIYLNIFNPLPLVEYDDIKVIIFNPIYMEDHSDILLDLVNTLEDDIDLYVDLVQQIIEDIDLKPRVESTKSEYIDIKLNAHTDHTHSSVQNIGTIIERRFLPFFPENVMFKPGKDTNRFKFMLAYATAERNARRNLENMITSVRLLTSRGKSLDYVGDRVGAIRWQFYQDRLERFESDTAYRARLIPYFREKRGTLASMQQAVAPLHDAYGGVSTFYSYIIGEGWKLGTSGYTELSETTYLGGPLLGMNPLELLAGNDIWILGTGLRPLATTQITFYRTNKTVNGIGTRFIEQVQPNDYFYYQNTLTSEIEYLGQVERVINNTTLVLKDYPNTTQTGWIASPKSYAKLPDGKTAPNALSHSDLGITTWLGDRARLTPFTFIVVVTNYPTDQKWRDLYTHTIDRFKMAGTIPIIIWRNPAMLRTIEFTSDGTDTYTLEDVNLETIGTDLNIDGVSQPPSSYTLTNSGDDTIVQFSENIPAGILMWITYWEEAS